MATSKPDWHIAQSNLRHAPHLAGLAGAAAIALAFFMPLYPAFLALAVVLGALTFVIQWIGVRRRAQLGWIGTILTIFGWSTARSWLLPPGLSTEDYNLAVAPFIAVWLLVFAVLHLVFRERLSKDLDDRAA